MEKVQNRNIRFLSWVLAIGVLLMAVKFLAWWLTNSNAILTDALESIINIVAGSFALYSLVVAAKPRDRNHPYGHGKIEFISAGFEGSLIFLAGAAIIGKSVYNLVYPQTIQQLDTGIYLTILTGGINFLMGTFLVRRGRKVHSLILQASGEHLQSDAWSSLGLIVGLGIVFLTGLDWLDNVVAFLFGLIILLTGIRLMRRSLAGIMDEADYHLIEKMVGVLDEHRQEDWIDVHNLRVIKYGATLHIDCHMTLPWYFNTREAHTQVKAFEEMVRKYSIRPVELFIHVDPCEPVSCRVCQKTNCPVRQHPTEQRLTWTLDNIMENKRHEMSGL